MAHTWTWDKLVKSATRLNPKSRGRNYPSTPKFETSEFTSGPERGQKVIIPFVGTKSVLISLKAWGVTQSSLHTITLQFTGVDIKIEDPMDRNYFKIVYKGQAYWIQKLDKFRHPLTSRCSCKDYFYTFSFYNYVNGHCLYGPMPRPYVRKTTWMPPRNKFHVPGVCKHIYNAWKLLSDSGLTAN